MATFKLDLRKILREIATKIQDENLDRLLTGTRVDGGPIQPRAARGVGAKGRAKRIRIFGLKVSLRELADKTGVKSGAMLKDVTKRSNQKIGRVGFKIIPSRDILIRWSVFNAGDKRQVDRPVSGVTDQVLDEARALVTTESRNQFVQGANARERG